LNENCRPSISRKWAGRFSPNFQGLRSLRASVYRLDPRLVGDQISGVFGGKMAKNGLAVWRWVTLSGSLIFSTEAIFNFSTRFVRGVIKEHRTCIAVYFLCAVKKLGDFEKMQFFENIAHFRTAVFPTIVKPRKLSFRSLMPTCTAFWKH